MNISSMLRVVLLALAVAVSGLAMGCATADAPAATADQREATELSQRVMARLTNDPFLERASIRATSDEGVVTLRGMLRNESQRARALSIARATPGVRGVIDQLRIF